MSFSERPARLVGLGAAFGEGLRPVVDSDVVTACYTVGALFIVAHCIVVLADTSDGFQVADTLIFELLASAFIPTAAAHVIMRLAYRLLDKLNASSDVREYAPTVFCILALVLLSIPVDALVNSFLDMSFRKVLK